MCKLRILALVLGLFLSNAVFGEEEKPRGPQTCEPASVFYRHDQRNLNLNGVDNFFEIKTDEYGAQFPLIRGARLMVFQRNSNIRIFGRGETNAFRMEGGFDYETSGETEISLSELWDDVSKNVSPRPDQNIEISQGVEIPARVVQDYLRDSSSGRKISATVDSQTGRLSVDTGLLEDLGGNVEFEKLFDYLEKARVLGEDIEAFREKLRLWEETLREIEVGYQDFVQGYLDFLKEEYEGQDVVFTAGGELQVEVRSSLRFSDWDFDIENRERGFYLALPAAYIPGLGFFQVGGGWVHKESYAVFRVKELAGRISGSVDGRGQVGLYRDGEEVFEFGMPLRFREEIEHRFRFSQPLQMESSKKKYEIVLVGLGIFREKRAEDGSYRRSTDLEGRVGFADHGVDQASISFYQEITRHVGLQFSASYEQIASKVFFEKKNVPEDILRQKEVNNLNEDIDEIRDYIAISEFFLGFTFGRAVRVDVAKALIGGPSIFNESGVELRLGRWIAGGAIHYYRFLAPGSLEDVSLNELGLADSWLGQTIGDERFEATQLIEDGRIVDQKYRFLLGRNFRRGAIVPSIDIKNGHGVESINCMGEIRNIEIFGRGAELRIFLRWGLEEGEVETAGISLNFRPFAK